MHRYAVDKTKELVDSLDIPYGVRVEIIPRFDSSLTLAQTIIQAPYGNMFSILCSAQIVWAKHAIDVTCTFPLESAIRIIDSIAAHEVAHLLVMEHGKAHTDAIHGLGYVDLFELPENEEYCNKILGYASGGCYYHGIW